MPISPNRFNRVRVLSAEFRAAIRELASDVAELMSLLPMIRRKITEPDRPLVQAGGISGGAVQMFVLDNELREEADDSPARWLYQGRRGEISSSTGLVTEISGADVVYLYNLAENDPGYQHGQDLSPSGATLTPLPVEGAVMALYTGKDDGGQAIWVFDVPNPMTVTCA
jgi:hypothetical protein